METEQQTDWDQHFDGSLIPVTERGCGFVDLVSGMLDAVRVRKIKRTQLAEIRALRATVVANLLVHYFQGGHGAGVAVSRTKHRQKENRYTAFVFPRYFPKLLDDLKGQRLLTQISAKYSGNRLLSRRTTVRASAGLVALAEKHGIKRADFSAGGEKLELIRLKRPKGGYGDEGGLVDYGDTDTTCRYREQMEAINKWLAQADITFEASAHDRHVDATQRRLWRSFTNGSFESGGRLWGGFWQHLPRKVRVEGIRIEGEAVAGMDYSSLYVALAYWKAGSAQPNGDAYTLSGFDRDLVKTIFSAMLEKGAAKRPKDVTRFPKGVRQKYSVPKHWKVTTITDAIRAKHSGLESLFGRGIIHAFQFHESEILLAVLETCHARGIVALPIHDCVVVKTSNAERVRRIMVTEFKTATGREVSVHADG